MAKPRSHFSPSGRDKRPAASSGQCNPADIIEISDSSSDDERSSFKPAMIYSSRQGAHRLTAPPSSPQPDLNWAGWNGDDQELNRILMEGYEANRQLGYASPLGQQIEEAGSFPQPRVETEAECIRKVLDVFPGICGDYVTGLYNRISHSSDNLVTHILDQNIYPRAKDSQMKLKRKRVVDGEKEAILKYEAADRRVLPTAHMARELIRSILSSEFADIPMAFIDATLNSSGHRLFSGYRKLEETQRTLDAQHPAYIKKKIHRRMPKEYQPARLDATISLMKTQAPEKAEILTEFKVSRMLRRAADLRRQIERETKLAEEEDEREAIAEGRMSECGCCFSDYPLNRMVHCNSEKVLHWFCRRCASQMASTAIGNSKYHLQCMSTEGCEAGFSISQRNQFLDEKLIAALERNETEAVLRTAGIENLASCPFCPYAAEYPPIAFNREFHCQAPNCEKVSCRLCKLESHLPKTCEEHKKDIGLSARHQVEEAMSAALIRKCNKCGTPFVKEAGCNKMECVAAGCGNIQCYVCSVSCKNYDHFNEVGKGGKSGNCPLFDDVEERHNADVGKAEKEAIEKIRTEHPEVTEEHLKATVMENVLKDDGRRKTQDALLPRPVAHPRPPGPPRQRLNFGLVDRHEQEIGRPQNLGALPAAANPPNANNPGVDRDIVERLFGPRNFTFARVPRAPDFGLPVAVAQQNIVYPVEMEGVEYDVPRAANFDHPSIPRAEYPQAPYTGPRFPHPAPNYGEALQHLQPNQFVQVARNLQVCRRLRKPPDVPYPLVSPSGRQVEEVAKQPKNMLTYPPQLKNNPAERLPENHQQLVDRPYYWQDFTCYAWS